MLIQRGNDHSVSRLYAHIVWSTKYRYSVLGSVINIRCRTLLIQICESEDVSILKGVVSKDHMHIRIWFFVTLKRLNKEVIPIVIFIYLMLRKG